VLLSKTHGGEDVAAHSPNLSHNDDTAGEYQISHPKSGMLGSEKIDSYYPFAGQEQRMERKSDKRSNIDNAKPMSSVKPTDKEPTTAATIPTSPRAGRYAKGQRLQQRQQRHSPQDSHVQRQGQGHLSSTTVAAGSILTPALSKTLKRKPSKAEGVPWAGDILITDADASSFPNKKKARKSGRTNEVQEVVDDAFEQLRKTTTAESMQDFNKESGTEFLDTNSDKHVAEDFTKDSIRRSIRHSTINHNSLTKPNHSSAQKLTKKARQQAHDNLLTTTTPPPCSFQYYTSSIPSNPQHCVKASQHSKIHATCFAWYHGFCPFGNKKEVGKKDKDNNGKKNGNGKKKKQKGKNKCKYLHALTEPRSYVQPPRGYVHGKDGQNKEGKHHHSNNEAEVEEIKTEDGKTEDSNMKEENTVLANTAQCTLDWCPGDWLWDHDHDDNHSHNHSSSEEETLDLADLTDSPVKISKNH
jgi:hypothetical protein